MPPTDPPIPVAQYLRMSTDDQPNSVPTQREAIQRYASAHRFEIVATYSDLGISGLQIRNRPGLTRLLRDVLSRKCRFKGILVYDVSRWGRFQDTDESAHYEFLCRRAGIPIYYCAEQFENDNRLPNAIMKTLKRTMAAEYSRELSVKIAAAHRRMAVKGYHVGGAAPYGFRRMLISADGQRRVLERGQSKYLKSDHTVLVLGPKRELESVRTIFHLAADKKLCPSAIAVELNRRNLRYWGDTPWDYLRVNAILRNERFLGYTVWGMRNTQFNSRPRRVPRENWVIKHGVFRPVITPEQFLCARKWIASRFVGNAQYSKEEILRHLASLVNRKIPTRKPWKSKRWLWAKRWRNRFGSILRAYELIGHRPTTHVVNSTTGFRKIRSLKIWVFNRLRELFPCRIRMARHYREQRFEALELDNRIRVAVYICRVAEPTVSGEQRWRLKVRPKDSHRPGLICLPDPELTRLTEFYFVKDLGSIDRSVCKGIGPNYPWFAEENHLGSLREFCTEVRRRMEGHPPAPLRTEALSVVGDVLFTEDDPTVIIDSNEIPLSVPTAAILKLLLQDAGKVVPRHTLSRVQTTKRDDKELYLNVQISKLRRALGPYRDRIVTVKKKGYVYQKTPIAVP
jgi:DNA invertase Pin-like site-specific DNA recombinase